MRTFRLCFVIALYLLCSIGNSQSIIFPIQHNVLIKGIPNYLSVGLKGIAADSIELAAHHSKLEKQDNWNWYITPDTGFKSETVIVKAWKENKLVSVDSTEFRLKWLPDPKIYIANRTGDTDSIQKSLLINAIVAARGENVDQDVFYQVLSFNMVLEGPYLSLVLHSDSASLTAEMRKQIMTAKPGQRVTFTVIRVKYPDGRIKNVDDVSLVLKSN